MVDFGGLRRGPGEVRERSGGYVWFGRPSNDGFVGLTGVRMMVKGRCEAAC